MPYPIASSMDESLGTSYNCFQPDRSDTKYREPRGSPSGDDLWNQPSSINGRLVGCNDVRSVLISEAFPSPKLGHTCTKTFSRLRDFQKSSLRPFEKPRLIRVILHIIIITQGVKSISRKHARIGSLWWDGFFASFEYSSILASNISVVIDSHVLMPPCLRRIDRLVLLLLRPFIE